MTQQHSSAKAQQLATATLAAFAALGIPLQAAYLHGSWGTEFERADSDLDLALLLPHPLEQKHRADIELTLLRALNVNAGIDMVDLRRVDTVFAAHVVAEAHRLFVTDRDATDHFEALTLAKYARLNEERVGILADIRQRGSIYGAGTPA